MTEHDPFAQIDVELALRPRFLEGSVRMPSGELILVRLTWQAWEEASGHPGPNLPSPNDRVARLAAWLAASDPHYSGPIVDGRFRLITPNYIRDAVASLSE